MNLTQTISPDLPGLNLSDVSNTALLTLYCHAMESQSENPILKDPFAEDIAAALDPVLAQSQDKLLRSLANRQIEPNLAVHIALRARKYDELATRFLAKNPDGILVNLGCGLDTRFYRIDNGKLRFFDVDLPEMIEVKRRLLPPHDRYQLLANSVFDLEWLEELQKYGDQPVMFLAEGLLMYLEPERVKALVLKLQKLFPGAELVCEVTHSILVSKLFRGISNIKMQRQLKLGAGAEFRFGVSSSTEMERWHPGIEFLEDWCYFQSDHPKLGWMRIFRHIRFMNKVQWTVHYRLNSSEG